MTCDETAQQEAHEAECPDQVDGLGVGLEVVCEKGLHGSRDGLDGSIAQLSQPGDDHVADAPGHLGRGEGGEEFLHFSKLLNVFLAKELYIRSNINIKRGSHDVGAHTNS